MLSTRLARQSCLYGNRLPNLQSAGVATMKPMTPESQTSQTEFWSKNKNLGRPISPHLTIYKFQLTSMLSITHRATGLAQSAMLSGVGLGALLIPGNFPMLLNDIAAMQFGSALIFTSKFVLAFPVMFHLWNGFRHLAWDLGHGFKIPEVYKTGWFVVGLSVVTALALAAV